MSTAGKIRRRELIAVLAALVAAAVLAAVLPQDSRGAQHTLPPSTSLPTDVIVRFAPQIGAADQRATIRAAGGVVTHDLHLIGGLGARMQPAAAENLRSALGVVSVSYAAPVASRGRDLEPVGPINTYTGSIGIDENDRHRPTGRGVGVAVIDTGIDGELGDFALSRVNRRSRVRAAVVVNPRATNAEDGFGHGTHVAGIIAGNGGKRRTSDRRRPQHVGVAPDARLTSIKISDDEGAASTLDAIYGIQFAVDHADTLDIDIINLSLASSVAESPATDPLAAAAEAAWLQGLVVVAAAGNSGTDPRAVSYAPGNDPYVLTVGATDDMGTVATEDDIVAPWSSRGRTQLGFAKPDVLAPGTRIVSTLAPGSRFEAMCPECVVEDGYFRAGGTSMATAVTSGAAALLLEEHPDWTPDQVKAALVGSATPAGSLRVDRALVATPDPVAVAQHHPVNRLVDAATGAIDYSAASWRAASWRYANRGESQRAGWAAASWRCDCSLTGDGTIDPQAASWRAASWRVLTGSW